MLENMGQRLDALSDQEVAFYHESVKDLGILLSQGDYLTVSDMLKYELIPLFEKRGPDNDNL